MRMVAVDDEVLQLEALDDALKECEVEYELKKFNMASAAFEFVKENDVDVVFLDIHMPGINGIDFAKKIKLVKPKINFIFVTGYSEYALEAMNLHASGYLTKPIDSAMLKEELENLRFPVLDNSPKRIRVQCFGNFEIFVDGQPVQFSSDKAKELLAYLVDRRGSVCTNGEISAVLWDDDENHDAYFQKLRMRLKDTLTQAGIKNLVFFGWGKLSLDTSMISCDYYDWLEGKVLAINAYHGEYMNNYPWAEFTNGNLYKNKQ